MSGKRPILDATAVLAIIQEEPGAERLLPLGREAAVSAVNLAEVLAKLVSKGVPRAEAQAAFEALHLEALPFDPAEAGISAFYWRKGVSLGDRCFLAAAYVHGKGWTADRALASLECERLPELEMFR